MSPHIALFTLGFLSLALGAVLLGFGVGQLARRLGASAWGIGFVVVPLAAAAPVFAVAINTAVQHRDTFTVGMILGSAVVNVAFALGTAALWRPLAGSSRLTNASISTLLVGVLFFWFVCRTGSVGPLEAVLLLVGFAAAVAYLVWTARSESAEVKDEFTRWNVRRWPPLVAVLGAILGIAAVVGGAYFLVPEAVEITKTQSKSLPLFGTVAIALATSLALLCVTELAARNNHGDLAITTVAIANLCILLLLPGVAGLVASFKIPPSMQMNDFPATALVVFLLLSPLLNGLRISRGEGVVLLLAFAGYFVWQVRR